MTARQMWNNAHRNNNLPKEWPTWIDFRAWVNTNEYKAQYGYKGEFTPESLLKAIPGQHDFNSLIRLKLNELKELAAEKGINIGEASTKKEIAKLIGGE